MSVTSETKTAPSDAFRFASPLAFQDAAGDESATEHRVTVHARTPGIVDHWYWGRIIHDMSGCRHRDTIPFDWRHDADEILGYADSIDASSEGGLTVAGPLQSIDSGDRASEVIARGRKGHPFEASIYWDESDSKLEYLDEGFIAEVNGQTVEGPCVIAREWTLRAVAITPHGVDKTTHTKFSADVPQEVNVCLKPAGEMKAMANEPTKDTAGNEPSETEIKGLFSRMIAYFDSQETKDSKPAPPADEKVDERAELARYMDSFPERGAEYFRDRLPFADAMAKELALSKEAIATKDSELKAAQDKLASLSLGEDEAVDTGVGKDSVKKKVTFSQYTRGER